MCTEIFENIVKNDQKVMKNIENKVKIVEIFIKKL